MERKPYYDRPCAQAPLMSYRYDGFYGWVMIGALDDGSALDEAARSVDPYPVLNRLQRWNSDAGRYLPVAA